MSDGRNEEIPTPFTVETRQFEVNEIPFYEINVKINEGAPIGPDLFVKMTQAAAGYAASEEAKGRLVVSVMDIETIGLESLTGLARINLGNIPEFAKAMRTLATLVTPSDDGTKQILDYRTIIVHSSFVIRGAKGIMNAAARIFKDAPLRATSAKDIAESRSFALPEIARAYASDLLRNSTPLPDSLQNAKEG